MTDSIILVATILLWSLAIDLVAYRFPRLSGVLKARPRILLRDGRPNRHVLQRELMTEDELMAQLRLHGVTSLDEVATAYLEPNGMISIVRRDGREPEEPVRPEATL